MKEDIAKAIGRQTAATLDNAKCWRRYGGFFGLDVHEDTIAVAIAKAGRDEPVYRGEVANAPNAIGKWLDLAKPAGLSRIPLLPSMVCQQALGGPVQYAG